MQKYLTIEIQDSEKNPIRLSLVAGTRILVRDAIPTFELSLQDLKDAVKELEKFEEEKLK
jgi:hypothetical protein